MRFKLVLAVTLCLLLSACIVLPRAAECPNITPVGSVRPQIERATYLYATKGADKLFLDRIVDHAVKIKGKRPTIIFSFGGGWLTGQRYDPVSARFFNHFASLGYVVITIDYRLGIKEAAAAGEMNASTGSAMYLRAIRWGVEDLYDATAYVLQHADEWNIDKNRIIVAGSSAGAINTLVAEYNVADETELAREHLPKHFNYAGAIAMAGAFWLPGNTPLTFKIRPCPIMFFHGSKDQLVTYDEAHTGTATQAGISGYGPVYFQKQFPKYSSWFIDLPGADHVMSVSPLIDYNSEIEAFLTKMVMERQQAVVHTIEDDKVKKTFGNFFALYGSYLQKAKADANGAATK